MTVKQLIEQLQMFSPDAEVVVRDNGGEFDTINDVSAGTFRDFRQVITADGGHDRWEFQNVPAVRIDV